MENILIFTENIRLDQALKWAGVVSTGGEAKILIAAGQVSVNGVVEKRRSRRLGPGEVIEIEGRGIWRLSKG